MPEGTRVARMVKALMREGYDKVSAIKIAQSRTGQSYMTGKPSKSKKKKRRKGRR